MIGSFLSDLTGHHQSDIFNIDRLATDAGIGGIRYTHNGANFTDGLHPSEPLVASADLWRGHRVILIVRDVRDIVVSAWHHARYREGITSASLSEFVRHPMTGIEKVLVAYNRWFDQLAEAAGLLVVSYEDMTADPVAVLRDSLVFIGLTDPDPGRLVTAADQCRFDLMQQRESAGFYNAAIATTTSSDDRARKVRVGTVGGYVDYLTAEDLDFVDRQVQRLGNPFEARTLAHRREPCVALPEQPADRGR